MVGNDPFELFANDLQQQVIAASELDGEESMRADAFTSIVIEQLIEAGTVDEGTACFYKSRGVEVSGYGYGHDGETLDLFVTIYRGGPSPVTITRTDSEAAINRCQAFLDQALDGLYKKVEESSEVFDMAVIIRARWDTIDQVRFFLLTDGIVKADIDPKKLKITGRTLLNIWDIQRLYRYNTAGQRQEPIHIDFVEEFGAAIPCLHSPEENPDYDAFLAIIPGRVLSTIYGRFGARLMELNVRSFLQARGKVNSGIRNTLIKEPSRFLAYNNGISATAEGVTVVDLPGGGKGIASIDNLQIVNGGQTTASIYQAAHKDGADISKVFVPAKISIPKALPLDEMVPLISRYANSQNKVDEADFAATDPFHVELERLSRSTWANPVSGTQTQTRWFYERARGQYQVSLAKEDTPAKQRIWKAVHPVSQRFSKTDLAKFVNTWDQLPHIVSLGGQKGFQQFALRVKKNTLPDRQYFQDLIAKAILFKTAQTIIKNEQFGGYRANIITYTIAYLARYASASINLDRIWATQEVPDDVKEAIRVVSHGVFPALVSPPNNGNVTEWAKKAACWDRVKALAIALPPGFVSSQTDVSSADNDRLSFADHAVIAEAADIPAHIWFEVDVWARQNKWLQHWQRQLCLSLGSLAGQEIHPSIKQARQGLILLSRARELGFVSENESEEVAD